VNGSNARSARLGSLLLAFAFAIVVGVLMTEVALRALYSMPVKEGVNHWHEHDPRLGWRNQREVRVVSELPRSVRRFEVRTNAWGLREDRELSPEPPPGKRRVAILGDSFAFGYCLERSEAFPAQLETLLGSDRFEVLNYGTCGYGVDQMRLLLDEALDRKPSLVVFSFIVDDLRRATRAAFQSGEPKPLFLLDGRALVLTNVPVPKLAVGDRVTRYAVRGSFVLWKIRDAWARIRRALASDPLTVDETWILGRAIVLDAARAAKARDVRFAVALLPKMKALQEDEPLRGHLREFEEAGVPAVDCHPAFLQRLENEPDAELFVPNDFHPSALGQRLIAEQIAAFLRARDLLD
jgi:lysophospholipase L1-like esterase